MSRPGLSCHDGSVPADLLALVEAAYRVDVSDDEWLAGVAKAGGDLFDRGLGVAAFVYAIGESGPAIERLSLDGPFDVAWLAAFQARTGRSPDVVGSAPVGWEAWLHLPVGMAARIPGMESFADAFASFGGAKDVFAINGRDPRGFGVWLGAPVKKSRALREEELALYSRVSTHLAAGYRLRRTLAGTRVMDHAEAVIDASGSIVHAENDARDESALGLLRRAALQIERARSKQGRREPEPATRAWRGLVDGRWTLLDQFETDGKRFVVATRNEVALKKPRPLSARERQVLAYAAMGQSNKEIAYSLGLSAATVRVLLARASQKLGVRGRSEAVAKFNTLAD